MPRRFSNCLNTGKIRNITCKEELRAGQGMDREKRMRAWIRAEVMLLFIMMGAFLLRETGRTESMEQAVVTVTSAAGKDYIKWVDFTVSYEALCQAYDWDVDTFDTEHHVEWIPLLAYTAARTGGEFDKKALKILNETSEKLAEGEAEIEILSVLSGSLQRGAGRTGGRIRGRGDWRRRTEHLAEKIRIKRLLPHCERI